MKGPEQNFEKLFLPKEEFLERLRWFRNDFIDDIPKEKVIPYETPNQDKYKCRANYFQGVVDSLSALDEAGLLQDKKTSDDLKSFLNYICNEKDFSKFTNAEDIKRVNEILDAVLVALS